MQTIRVKEIKAVTSKKTGKEFLVVVDEKGAEFTTFDKTLQQVTPGSLLAIEPKVNGKFVNIESWEIKEEVGKTSPIPKYGKSSEELELGRRSFALSYAKDLAVAGKIEVDNVLGRAAGFYEWLKKGQEVSPSEPLKENPETDPGDLPLFKEEPITKEQFKVINSWLKDDKAKARIQSLAKGFGWKVKSPRQFSKAQAARLIGAYTKEIHNE